VLVAAQRGELIVELNLVNLAARYAFDDFIGELYFEKMVLSADECDLVLGH
jgi:hypothetical protein